MAVSGLSSVSEIRLTIEEQGEDNPTPKSPSHRLMNDRRPEVGSLRHMLVSNPRTRLYIDPLLWTDQHLLFLRVFAPIQATRACGPFHRMSCSIYLLRGHIDHNLLDIWGPVTLKDVTLGSVLTSWVASLQEGLEIPLFEVREVSRRRR